MKFLNARRSFQALYFLLVFLLLLLATFFCLATWENDFLQSVQLKSLRTQILVEDKLLEVLNRVDNDSSLYESKFELTMEKYRQLLNLTNPGDMGEAVVLPKHLPEDIKKLIDDGWRDYTINQFVSDLVPLRRSLPDIRGDYCKTQTYENLPKASVIIIFHNEAWSMVKLFNWLSLIELSQLPIDILL